MCANCKMYFGALVQITSITKFRPIISHFCSIKHLSKVRIHPVHELSYAHIDCRVSFRMLKIQTELGRFMGSGIVFVKTFPYHLTNPHSHWSFKLKFGKKNYAWHCPVGATINYSFDGQFELPCKPTYPKWQFHIFEVWNYLRTFFLIQT